MSPPALPLDATPLDTARRVLRQSAALIDVADQLGDGFWRQSISSRNVLAGWASPASASRMTWPAKLPEVSIQLHTRYLLDPTKAIHGDLGMVIPTMSYWRCRTPGKPRKCCPLARAAAQSRLGSDRTDGTRLQHARPICRRGHRLRHH